MGDILSDVEDVKISSNLILASWNCWERDIILNFFFPLQLFWLWLYINYKEPDIKLLFVFI